MGLRRPETSEKVREADRCISEPAGIWAELYPTFRGLYQFLHMNRPTGINNREFDGVRILSRQIRRNHDGSSDPRQGGDL